MSYEQYDEELARQQREAERRLKRQMTERILELTRRVPPKVLSTADAHRAAAWKEHASKALRTSKNERATLPQLRAALAMIEQYE